MLRRILPLLSFLLLMGLCGGAWAQDSTIIGTVIDAQNRQPVPNAVVTATSPNLQGERTAVTDADGNYRLAQLPPGIYTLRFEADTYKPYARADIQLRFNRTIRVNVELLPKSLGSAPDGTPPTDKP